MVALISGATGTQGMAVALALKEQGRAVRGLVRDAASPLAAVLERAGAELRRAAFEDEASLLTAMEGVTALFSVQPAPQADRDSERRQARALIGAARAAGVGQIVHSSVSNTGSFAAMAGWEQGRWERNYWESKRDVEEMVRQAGFPCWTILRPAFMMDNFIRPKSDWMFPDLARGEILTAIAPDTRMVLIAAEDIGHMAAAALAKPDRFHERTIELAGDQLTLPEIAAILTDVRGEAITARTLEPDELIARGQSPGWVESQQWMNAVNYPARPEEMEALGLVPTRFRPWAQKHPW